MTRRPLIQTDGIGSVARRLDMEERRTEVPAPPPTFGQTFTHPGAITVLVSGRWYPFQGGRLVRAHCSLATVGSSPTVIDLYLNGNSY